MDYLVGGGVPPGASSYVKRQADEVLFESLLRGEFCYVLNSRQMGKTSLRFEVQRRLRAEGVVCASVDLQAIGKKVRDNTAVVRGDSQQLGGSFARAGTEAELAKMVERESVEGGWESR